MAVRKQRATTSETYVLELDYKECLSKAKRMHRNDMEFYIYQINNSYCSISKMDYATNPAYREEPTLEYWIFSPYNKKWSKMGKR